MAYATNTNNRVFYATQAVAVGDEGAVALKDSWSPASGATTLVGSGSIMVAHGVQSIGVSTNFNLEQIFELGQLAIYDNYEEIPEIEITFEKVLDGYSLLYHLGTVDATGPRLTERAKAKADIRMAIGLDTGDYMGTGINEGNSGVAELYCSGTYISSLSYSLGTDGNFTESTTFVGNDKRWFSEGTSGLLVSNSNGLLNLGSIFKGDKPETSDNAVLRRGNMIIGTPANTTRGGVSGLQTLVPNIIPGGATNTTLGFTGCVNIVEGSGPYIQSVNISVDLGREAIQQLGKRSPYLRFVNFPVDVTCDIEVLATKGDNVNAYENVRNLSNHSIQFVLDDSTVFQLGSKNKLTSVQYGGGDAGGGNATVTYSFVNSSEFAVLHSGDPASISAANYWKNNYPAA